MHGFAARLIALALVTTATLSAGCASTRGPEVVTIPATEYDVAFQSAIDAVRSVGMPADLLDRRNGIVETNYRTAGTTLEPWRPDSSTITGTIESSINHERRKARIEFTPVRFVDETNTADTLTGPDLVGEREDVVDLTRYDGRIEVRAWVQVERSTVVGKRVGTWSRRETSMTIDPDSGLGPAQTFWTPVTRDTALERRLLRAIEKAIAGQAEQTASANDAAS